MFDYKRFFFPLLKQVLKKYFVISSALMLAAFPLWSSWSRKLRSLPSHSLVGRA